MRIILNFIILSFCSELVAQQSRDVVINSLKTQFELTDHDQPSIVIQFNTDTILVAGYIENISSSTHSLVYRTENRGKTWNGSNFNGDAWIYDSHHNSLGQLWLAGSDHYIHYSSNYGMSWERRPKPFSPTDRVLSIYMKDSIVGIAGGLHNGLAITYDNWKSTIQIPTPLDQGKFQILENSARDRVDNVAIVDSLIVIDQNSHIYYSKLPDIKWTVFNIPVNSFSIKEEKIHLHSLNGKTFVVSSKLDLINTYREAFLWTTIPKVHYQIDLEPFLDKGIRQMTLISTDHVFVKHGGHTGIPDVYEPKQLHIKIINENESLYLKKKGKKKIKLELEPEDLNKIFGIIQSNISLDSFATNLKFTSDDYESYQRHLESEKAKRQKEKVWGGDFSRQISINNEHFSDYSSVCDDVDPDFLKLAFSKSYVPFEFALSNRNKIEIQVTNKTGETMTISNAESILFSLPWKIQYGNQTSVTYSQVISGFVQKALPKDDKNYETLLGGELIFKLIEELIIEETKYIKGS